jgi:signal transduction histidine kinase
VTTLAWGGRIAPWSPTRDKWYDRALVVGLLLPAPIMLGTAVDPLTAVLSALQIAPLWWRRSHPDLCFVVVAAVTAAQLPLTDTPIWGQVAMPFAIYSVAAFSTPRRSFAAVGVGLVGSLAGPVDWVTALDLASLYPLVLFVGACALSVVAPWALGMLTRTRRAYVAQLIERSERIEREAQQRAELAASDERARIAREMHDVVAHGLSVMVVQADGARYAAASDPSAATQALETIGDTGRESLTEMRRLLGLLRSDDSAGALRPQPGLVDLEYLLAESSGAGMHLTTDVDQPLPDVSPGVGLTVYRVVQEALTNVRKHAGPDPQVRVAVRRLGEGIRVTVEDDGRGASARDDGQGHGVVGMKERVHAVGGSLEAGPRPGGGFRVEALVPVGGGR